MLSFHDRDRKLGRRTFLKIGGLGLGGLTLGGLQALRTRAAESGVVLKDKSVIFLFLHGGPSQIETFDPKMTAPVGIQSATGEIATGIPGVTFGSTFERLAALTDQFSIVRSFQSGDGRHDIKPIVSRDTLDANLGAIYSRIAGTNHPATGMPTNVALFPRAIDPERQAANQSFGNFGSTGTLGSSFSPFVPGGGGEMQQNMELHIDRSRLDDRRYLLGQLDRIYRSRDESDMLSGLDAIQQQAFQTILGGVARAFDLSNESPATVARYDTEPLLRPDQIDKKWNNYNNYVDNVKTLGKLLLMARRLCEAGCGFVTVTTNFVWDMHADVNNVGVEEGMGYMGRPLDHALSALLEDLKARGLSDDILVVVTGEMGRTPRINKNGGRDHWGNLTPLLLAGGGIDGGQVIGQSTRDAGEPLTEPIRIPNLVSTVLRTLFDPGQLRLIPGIPSDIQRLVNNDPIVGLT